MRILRSINIGVAGLLAAGVLAACSTTNISVQQAAGVETLDLQTYAWASESFIANPPEGYSRARLNALRNAITQSLDQKGYDRIDDTALADLMVDVDVLMGYNEGRGETYFSDDDEDGADDDNIEGNIRVYEGRQKPTSTGTRSQRNRAATMARSMGEDAGFAGEVRSLISIAISDRTSSEQLWRGSIDKMISLADIDSFVFEIDRDVAELFADFPSSRASE